MAAAAGSVVYNTVMLASRPFMPNSLQPVMASKGRPINLNDAVTVISLNDALVLLISSAPPTTSSPNGMAAFPNMLNSSDMAEGSANCVWLMKRPNIQATTMGCRKDFFNTVFKDVFASDNIVNTMIVITFKRGTMIAMSNAYITIPSLANNASDAGIPI